MQELLVFSSPVNIILKLNLFSISSCTCNWEHYSLVRTVVRCWKSRFVVNAKLWQLTFKENKSLLFSFTFFTPLLRSYRLLEMHMELFGNFMEVFLLVSELCHCLWQWLLLTIHTTVSFSQHQKWTKPTFFNANLTVFIFYLEALFLSFLWKF